MEHSLAPHPVTQRRLVTGNCHLALRQHNSQDVFRDQKVHGGIHWGKPKHSEPGNTSIIQFNWIQFYSINIKPNHSSSCFKALLYCEVKTLKTLQRKPQQSNESFEITLGDCGSCPLRWARLHLVSVSQPRSDSFSTKNWHSMYHKPVLEAKDWIARSSAHDCLLIYKAPNPYKLFLWVVGQSIL